LWQKAPRLADNQHACAGLFGPEWADLQRNIPEFPPGGKYRHVSALKQTVSDK
jgi:hypothetical protein